jgi:hypothetical protein
MVSLPARAFGQCDEPAEPAYTELMSQTRAAVEAEDFEAALTFLSEAHERFPDVAILNYSMARAMHHLEQYEEAEAAYNAFLREFAYCADPADLRSAAVNYRNLAVEQQRAILQQETAEQQRAEADAAARDRSSPTPPPEEGPSPGWWLVGGGGLLLVTGTIIDLSNLDIREDLSNAYAEGRWDEALELEADRDRVQTLEVIFYGSGLALVAAGALWILLDGPDDAAAETMNGQTAGVSFATRPDGHFLLWGGAF